MSLVLPLLVFGVATAGLAALVEPFVGWYFQFAWWSYILFADALNHHIAGRSLLRDERARFVWLAGVSVVLWTFFEALNLRLGNWYYVMDHPSRAVRWTGGVAAFATVLPGLFETEALVANLGRLQSLRTPRLRWSRAHDLACPALGLAALLVPLVWPDVFFFLVWVGLALLLEPWNRRHAATSLARDLERGEAAPLARWLLTGLACGLLWETWNHAARVKWIYTVPFVASPRLFEMPLAGFLGFPAFAVECLAVVRALEAAGQWLRAGPASTRRAVRLVAWTSASAATLAVFALADDRTVDSYYVPVAELRVLPPAARATLTTAGLATPERLLRVLDGEAAIRKWAVTTSIPVPVLRGYREQVALVMHRGLGESRALEMLAVGVRTRADLAEWTPEGLAAALRALGARGPHSFLERRARVWLAGLAPGPAAADPGYGGAADTQLLSRPANRRRIWARPCCRPGHRFPIPGPSCQERTRLSGRTCLRMGRVKMDAQLRPSPTSQGFPDPEFRIPPIAATTAHAYCPICGAPRRPGRREGEDTDGHEESAFLGEEPGPSHEGRDPRSRFPNTPGPGARTCRHRYRTRSTTEEGW